MRIGILYSRIRVEEKLIIQAMEVRGLVYELIDIREAVFDLQRPQPWRRFDLILANPPRTGMGAGVPRLIGEHAPERVILVSCDPATLGRDTGRLAREGYVARRAIPIDLFPQTAQVETVLLLTRS